MSQSLFRQEAIDNLGGRFVGDDRLIPPPPSFTISIGLLIALILLGGFIASAHYSRAEQMVGTIDTPLVKHLMADRFGEVLELDVAEGDMVKKGDRLALISRQSSQQQHEVLARLQEEQRTITQLIQEAKRSHNVHLSALAEQKRTMRSSLVLAREETRLQRQQTDQVQLQLEKQHRLKTRGFLSEAAWLQQQSIANDATQRLRRLQQTYIQQKAQIAQLEATRNDAISRHEQALAELKIRLSVTERQQTQFLHDSQQQLLAPVTGHVTRLSATKGDWVSPGSTLISISKGDTLVSATVYASSRAVAHLKPGQVLPLRLDRKQSATEEVSGRVVLVPPHPINGGNEQGLFAVRLALTPNSDSKQSVLPGMIITTEVLTHRKRLYRWLTDPLTRRLDAL